MTYPFASPSQRSELSVEGVFPKKSAAVAVLPYIPMKYEPYLEQKLIGKGNANPAFERIQFHGI